MACVASDWQHNSKKCFGVEPVADILSFLTLARVEWGMKPGALSGIGSKFTSFSFFKPNEDHSQFHTDETSDEHQVEFDPEADDYSDVFLGRNPTRLQDDHEEYGWWQSAQRRYRIFGGTQRMCGCSFKTCMI